MLCLVESYQESPWVHDIVNQHWFPNQNSSKINFCLFVLVCLLVCFFKILKAEIGINPNNDGKVIRLSFPELTEERRKELVKEIKKMGEESKVSVRSVRREGMDMAKAEQKEGTMTEDELKMTEDKIQKLTDNKVGEIDKIIENKEKEIMSV